MTLDEAIEHCEDRARTLSDTDWGCALDHMQLADWLRELRERKNNDKNT